MAMLVSGAQHDSIISIYFKMIPPRGNIFGGVYYVNELDGVGKTLFALVSQGNQGHR